jgi:hypothetical protein
MVDGIKVAVMSRIIIRFKTSISAKHNIPRFLIAASCVGIVPCKLLVVKNK